MVRYNEKRLLLKTKNGVLYFSCDRDARSRQTMRQVQNNLHNNTALAEKDDSAKEVKNRQLT